MFPNLQCLAPYPVLIVTWRYPYRLYIKDIQPCFRKTIKTIRRRWHHIHPPIPCE